VKIFRSESGAGRCLTCGGRFTITLLCLAVQTLCEPTWSAIAQDLSGSNQSYRETVRQQGPRWCTTTRQDEDLAGGGAALAHSTVGVGFCRGGGGGDESAEPGVRFDS